MELQKTAEFRKRADTYSNKLDALANVTEFMQHMAAACSVLRGDNNLPAESKGLMEASIQLGMLDANNAKLLHFVTESIRQIEEVSTENLYALARASNCGKSVRHE
jgi:DNA repair ATPase RecN